MRGLRDLPDDVSGHLTANRIQEWLTLELDGKKQLFAADYGQEVAVVVLERESATMLYVQPPHTIVRELLHLEGASVRVDYRLSDNPTTHLSVRLDEERTLDVLPETIEGFADLDVLRAELEKRAQRLGH